MLLQEYTALQKFTSELHKYFLTSSVEKDVLQIEVVMKLDKTLKLATQDSLILITSFYKYLAMNQDQNLIKNSLKNVKNGCIKVKSELNVNDLTVTVWKASNLPNMDVLSKNDSYCTVSMQPCNNNIFRWLKIVSFM